MALVLGGGGARSGSDVTLRRAVRTLFRRERLESEMDAEMQLHLELEAEELVKGGMSPKEAYRQAALVFGGVQQRKEEVLEEGGFPWLDALQRDVRIATRTLLRHPTFAITATLALALAIAVNTTMFSVLDAMINPRIGVRNPEQLHSLRYFGRIGKRVDVSERDRILGESGRTYSAVTASGFYGFGGANVERGALVRLARVIIVRPNYFTVMGVAPLQGTLSPASDPATAATTVVISNRLRTEVFRDDESPIGQTIEVDARPYRIIGVTTRYAGAFSLDTDIWMFPRPGAAIATNLIRLRSGMTKQDAAKELDVLAARLAIAEGESTKDSRFDISEITQQFEIQRFHWALIGAGLAVLIVACTNLANLQLARGLGRASELAVRSALGASRPQIVSQLMIESGVLAAAALVLALLLTLAGNALLQATIPPNVAQYVVEPQSSWRMVLFAATAAVMCLTLVGLAPAIRVSRVDLNSLLKSRAGTGAHRTNRRTYGALVVTQIALTLPLVSAAVLLSRSALRTAEADYRMREEFGFDTGPLIVANFFFSAPAGTKLPIAEIAENLVSRARGVADVADAGIVFRQKPMNGVVTVEDTDGGIRETFAQSWSYEVVTPSYFRTMGLPIERGSDFPEGGNTVPALIMDRSTGWHLWPRSSPIGRMVKLDGARTAEPWIKVNGVVGDQLSQSARELRRAADTLRINHIYRLMTASDSVTASSIFTLATLYVRAKRDPQRVASSVRRVLSDVAQPDFAPASEEVGAVRATRPPRVQLFEEYLGIPQRITVLRFIAGLFTTFGVLALGLSALGVYGIVAQSVADRKREVAVRISLGATSSNIVHALLREGNVLVLAGVAIGLYATKQTIGWLGSFLGEVDLTNALLFGAVCVALFAAMVLSALVPAVRATKLDPMEVLRAE
ncbi:MAG: permease [Gemmatimonadetes bacterium]|nr:permease [Gemmatimonadota bacterium]